MDDILPPSALLRERFRKLQDFNKGNIILHLPVENILDSLFDERLEKNDLLPIGKKGNYLLVEISYYNPLIGLQNLLLRIKSRAWK